MVSKVTDFEKPLPVLVAIPGQKEPVELLATSVELLLDGFHVSELILRNGDAEVARFPRNRYIWWKIGDPLCSESFLAF